MPKKSVPKKSGWKDTKTRVKNAKNLKLGLTVLGLVILIIILGQFFNLLNSLTTPLDLTSKAEKKYTWDGKFSINIVIQTNTTHLFNFNPAEQKVTLISIPDEAYLDASSGFGKWMLGSINDVGESSKKGMGSILMKTSLSLLFGIPIDGYIRFDRKIDMKDLIELIRQSPFSGLGLVSDMSSDLTPVELLRLKFGLMKVRFDKIIYLDLVNLAVFDMEKLPDGTKVLVSDPVKLDSILTNFVDSKIREENLSIAVFNATDYPQLAQKAKRMVTNLGGNVIIISNYPKVGKTYVLGEKGDSLERLSQIFSSCQKCDNIIPNEQTSRSQINIFLGEDFANLW